MFRGLYTAWTGMANEQKRLDVISNNMANSNTVGYKDEKVASQAFDQVLAIKVRDGSEAYHNEAIGHLSLYWKFKPWRKNRRNLYRLFAGFGQTDRWYI